MSLNFYYKISLKDIDKSDVFEIYNLFDDVKTLVNIYLVKYDPENWWQDEYIVFNDKRYYQKDMTYSQREYYGMLYPNEYIVNQINELFLFSGYVEFGYLEAWQAKLLKAIHNNITKLKIETWVCYSSGYKDIISQEENFNLKMNMLINKDLELNG